MIQRVLITENACQLIDELRNEHGPLIFHQSGGCCDGSAPMCLPEGELMLNETDILLNEVHSCPFYMAKDQFDYWKHTQLTLDVVAGRGAGFSLETSKGMRFVIKSRLFTEAELEMLESANGAI